MAGDGDLKDHALNSSHDFYALLEVDPTAGDSEIRRAFRRTALKYHPDKVGTNEAARVEKFHLLLVAYDVLQDSTARQLYDNARRAREETTAREAAYEGRRRHLKEELERREHEGVAGLKRKRGESAEEEAFQRELRRLAADGARRRKEREEQLREEAREELEREQSEQLGKTHPGMTESSSTPANHGPTEVNEIDRTITFRCPVPVHASGSDLKPLDREVVISRFGRFGKVEEVLLRSKKIKVDGEKHRRDYTTAIVVFKSIVGAHAAVMEIPALADSETKTGSSEVFWAVLEKVGWASGNEPDCIPKPIASPADSNYNPNSRSPDLQPSHSDTLADRLDANADGNVPNKTPSFGSFKGLNKTMASSHMSNGSNSGFGNPTAEELTMIRLKNAERRRLAEKLRKEEEDLEASSGN